MAKELKFISPIDGDMLNERDGSMVGGRLVINAAVSAEPGHEIIINGRAAVYKDGLYTAEAALDAYSNTIEACDKTTGGNETIKVYRLDNITGKYRLSLDDNIWFLQDIAENADKYKSIFENPYLALLRQVHEEFGTKVHINIYYQTEGFNLSQMPAKYKDEWKSNADWLRLSFHALANEPDMPYKNSSYNEVKNDCEKVLNEIRRFAGEEVLGPVTTLHWGEATVDGCRALRELGYKCQVGDFNVDNDDLSPVSYYHTVETRRHINRRYIWKDNNEDIIFFRSAIIIDCHKRENIESFLDEIWSDPHRSCYMDLLIHEQYFYPHYVAYQKDYADKVRTAVKWAVEKGYKSEFLEKCVF